MQTLILIIEDDAGLRHLLSIELEKRGYDVIVAADGETGLEKFQKSRPDLAVIDVALPKLNGREVCRHIREESLIPILLMSAHSVTEEEIALGLDLGADEYMLKPLGSIEFHARVKALLRRANFNASTQQTNTVYSDGYLSIDINARRITADNTEIRLTPTEFSLLATFLENAGNVLTFERILETVWGPEYKREHHYPRIYVSHLRRKIEPDIKNPTYIHNEYGVGYRFTGLNTP